jgi:hypothetical protein
MEPRESDVLFLLFFLVVGFTLWLWWKEREIIRCESIKMHINKSVKRENLGGKVIEDAGASPSKGTMLSSDDALVVLCIA